MKYSIRIIKHELRVQFFACVVKNTINKVYKLFSFKAKQRQTNPAHPCFRRKRNGNSWKFCEIWLCTSGILKKERGNLLLMTSSFSLKHCTVYNGEWMSCQFPSHSKHFICLKPLCGHIYLWFCFCRLWALKKSIFTRCHIRYKGWEMNPYLPWRTQTHKK